MEFGWDILWFIVGVSLLVTVHEFGHFWVARKLGFKVLRFSVGFGRPLWKKVGPAPDYTEFVIAAVPLGGYVRMLDERDGDVPPEDRERAFGSRPAWQRILVMLAGPAMNVLFAVAILWAMLWYSGLSFQKPIVGDVSLNTPAARAGLRSGDEFVSIDGAPVRDHFDVALGLLDAVSSDGSASIDVRGKQGGLRHLTLQVPDPAERHRLTEPNALLDGLGFEFWFPPIPAKLGEVEAGGPAARAGLRSGDLVVAVDGNPGRDYAELASYIRARPGKTLSFDLRRGSEQVSIRVPVASEQHNGRTIGRVHIGPDQALVPPYPDSLTTHVKLGPLSALGRAFGRSWELTTMQAKFFARMLTGHVSIKNLSGAISIAEVAGESAHAGADSFLQFLVLVSLSLGFLNLLPIPILDGGQIVFQLIEWAKGRPLSERAVNLGQSAGIVLLVLLMGVALFNDISGIAARP